MKWIDVYEQDPIRHQDILFLTGSGQAHMGAVYKTEKIRKCEFVSHIDGLSYYCDSNTELDDRVTHWIPIPELGE